MRGMGGSVGAIRSVTRTAVSSSASGAITAVVSHNGVTALFVAMGFGLAVNLPAVFSHIPAIIRAWGFARAKITEANTKQIEAEVKKIRADSDRRNAAKRTDADARASARRARLEKRMLLKAQKKSNTVENTLKLLDHEKTVGLPKDKHNDPDPGSGAPNVRPIRGLG